MKKFKIIKVNSELRIIAAIAVFIACLALPGCEKEVDYRDLNLYALGHGTSYYVIPRFQFKFKSYRIQDEK